jgi:sulfonate transport system permease protein
MTGTDAVDLRPGSPWARLRGDRRSEGMWWFAGIAVLVLAWEATGRAGLLGTAWPPLSSVLDTLRDPSHGNLIRRSLLATLTRAGLGYVLGTGIALILAVVVLLVPRLYDGLYRLGVVINAIPLIALGPLLVATLPRENAPAVAALLGVFFTTLVAAVAGLMSAGKDAHDLFTVIGASKRARLWHLQLPAAIPTLLTGLKLAVPAAILGEILGEWFGSNSGLGILLLTSMDNYRIDMLWAAALVAASMSMFLYGAIAVAERAAGRRYPRPSDFRRTERSQRRGPLRSFLRILAPFWSVAMLVAVWQWWVRAKDIPSIVLPAPSSVLSDLAADPAAYLGPTLFTIGVSLLGLLVGMTFGAFVALVMSRFKLVRATALPAALIFQTIPVVVAIPVIARIVGYSDVTVAVVAIGISFFPSFVLIESGLRMTPPGAEDVFSVMGSTVGRRLRLLRLPSAVPNAFVALRISAASCVIGALVADWLIGRHGLGALFGRERSRLDISRAWGAILISTALSVAAFLMASAIERRARERMT